MPPVRRLWPLAACVTVGAALYVSRGVLDAAVVDGRAVRIALLPPWETLLAFITAALFGLLLVDQLARCRSGARPALGGLVMPALGLGVLLVPFLPWLPDRWPVLQVLAGPLRPVVWATVGGLLLWTWRQHGLLPTAALARRSTAQLALLVALGVAVVSGATAARLVETPLFPAGDEPHYLVIAQSLWRDGDFKIENNHQRGDYREYFRRDLDPHYLTRGADGEIYSIHPVGLPILLTPIYGLGGYRAVLAALILMAALATALAWRWVATTLQDRAAATFAAAVVAGSAPFLFNTFTVYPEIAAALAVMVALTTRHPVVAGLACGMLPWLSTKYAPMSAVLLVTGLVGPAASPFRWPSWPAVLGRGVPYGVLLLAWFAFFYVIWGTPLPQAPYGAMVQTTPWNLVFGAPGLLFDQEYGLLAYAPAYVLAATGLWHLWRTGGEQRLLAIRVVLVFGALLGTVGAFRIWWGGSAAPARPLASGLLVLTLPIAAAYAAAPAGSARRAAQHLLLWVGAAIAATMALAQEGLLIANGRDGTSSLLEWWSPRWELWTLAPSFIHHEAPTALAHSLLWLAVAGGAAWLLSRAPVRQPGPAALTAFAAFALALGTVSLALPWLPDDPSMPRVHLDARSRLAALDRYDATALPAAVVYDPLRKRAADEALPLFALGVQPGLRPEPQPLRVLHNGRFSLPAGRYEVTLTFAPGLPARAERVSLQIGRVGAALETWPVAPAQGSLSRTINLPVDMSFVGFRGSRDLEAALTAIVIRPTSLINEGARVRTPTVLSSARYGRLEVLLHDDWVSLEPEGFWVPGQRPTRVSVAASATSGDAHALRLRSAVGGNEVTLRSHGWVHTLTLDADLPQEVVLPPLPRGVLDLTIRASAGFVPADRDPTSRDRRFLGVWVEAVHQPAVAAVH